MAPFFFNFDASSTIPGLPLSFLAKKMCTSVSNARSVIELSAPKSCFSRVMSLAWGASSTMVRGAVASWSASNNSGMHDDSAMAVTS